MDMPILIVDDHKTMRRILRGLLRTLGFENIKEAGDGRSALSMLEDERYGLVISDWDMEPMDGLKLLEQMRTDCVLETTPFILMTGTHYTDEGVERSVVAEEAGANGFLRKPFDKDRLLRRIETAIGSES